MAGWTWRYLGGLVEAQFMRSAPEGRPGDLQKRLMHELGAAGVINGETISDGVAEVTS